MVARVDLAIAARIAAVAVAADTPKSIDPAH